MHLPADTDAAAEADTADAAAAASASAYAAAAVCRASKQRDPLAGPNASDPAAKRQRTQGPLGEAATPPSAPTPPLPGIGNGAAAAAAAAAPGAGRATPPLPDPAMPPVTSAADLDQVWVCVNKSVGLGGGCGQGVLGIECRGMGVGGDCLR